MRALLSPHMILGEWGWGEIKRNTKKAKLEEKKKRESLKWKHKKKKWKGRKLLKCYPYTQVGMVEGVRYEGN